MVRRAVSALRSAHDRCPRAPGHPDRHPRTAARLPRPPSGWTPLALLKHLVFVERRWLRWGFAGEHVDPSWGENDPDEAVPSR
ncbi:mycothiol transferase [Streptomyces chiangmaiensis]|uniref:DUF664 domain-containing protein n=1 Tax=Streptomyces chiangmaiensis TaxID=766497 RepID=A0ABU7FL30_9ACTN|nr:DUF664 domain-containing protein [Streptomyces chiangmaiensis]MED7824674.1 DUF664 domain-containing protein [Streptomyces chiangmaiensis]